MLKEKLHKKNKIETKEGLEESTNATGENAAAESKPKKQKRKKMGKKKKVALIIVAVLVVSAVALSQLLGGDPAGYQVMTGTAENMDIREVVSIKGAIQGSESADVSSANNYKITEIFVEEGSQVKAGQILAKLDGGELMDNYKKAQLALSESKRIYESSKLLYEQGAMAKDEYLKAKAVYDTDSLNVSAFDGLDAVNVKSPIAGTVTRVNVNIGKYALDTENKEPMFVVENLEKLQMKVKISEFDISKIKVGQTVDITAEVLGDQEVKGVVSRISPTGEQKDQSSAEMVIPVIIDVDKGDTNLIAGVTAKAAILIEKREKTLAVPIDAILEDPTTGENSVFTVKDSIVKKIPVKLGLEGDFNIEIFSKELKQGDVVVLAPTFDLSDGMTVVVSGGTGANPAAPAQ